MTGPGERVLAAFGLTGRPVPLPGGQGRTWAVADAVLQPSRGAVADRWTAETTAGLVEDGFRVARPLRPGDGWTVDGWTAWTRVAGEHRTWDADWPVALEVAVRLHRALRGAARPPHLDDRTDVFARADRCAWGEAEIDAGGAVGAGLTHLRRWRTPLDLPAQVVHGDVAGNLLWADEAPPAVIDLSPSWRPGGLGAAQVVVDAVLWYGADVSLAELFLEHEPAAGRQLVLRALMFRLAIDALLADGADGDVRWSPDQVLWDLERADPLVRWLGR
ncbi:MULTISPECIES: hypothetical protein [unclassified Nocardioides]|uniref:hypothetical protein n=1 Tax=Nocardioides sp. URHA0032 TaxID=1380388 RepID=UPI000683E8ED|nr:hypothetical protein [Nocardioides sp. URHA0032]